MEASIVASAEGHPTEIGICLEIVRQSARYNMITKVREAISAAAAIGVYLGLVRDPASLEKADFWMRDFSVAYKNKTFAKEIGPAADAVPSGRDYEAALARHGGSRQVKIGPRELVDEAVRECEAWAHYARAEEPWETVDVWYGIMRLLDEQRAAPPLPPPTRKVKFLARDAEEERPAKRLHVE